MNAFCPRWRLSIAWVLLCYLTGTSTGTYSADHAPWTSTDSYQSHLEPWNNGACLSVHDVLPTQVNNNSHSLNFIENRNNYWAAWMSQGAPACIVYPRSAGEIAVMLRIIKFDNISFAIKAGGQDFNGFSAAMGNGVLMDLQQMSNASYNPATQLVTYEPGLSYQQLYGWLATQWNRTIVGSRVGSSGSGTALNGGLSYLSPQYGLACDSFRELEVVLPNSTVVKATPTENSDLFFALRGGGGNAYGIVTKFTVQTRPISTFTAGYIIYGFDQKQKVLSTIANHTMYNTDPKMSVTASFNKLGTRAPDMGLQEAIIVTIVYDGRASEEALKPYRTIPWLFSTMNYGVSYPDVSKVREGLPIMTETSRGNNFYAVMAQHVNKTDLTYEKAYALWEDWFKDQRDSVVVTSIDIEPVPRSLTDASKAQNGGNAMQLPDGPWMWIKYFLSSPPDGNDGLRRPEERAFQAMIDKIQTAKGLPLLPNYANYAQHPLQSFSTYKKLEDIKRKYDPESFFKNNTGSWRFDNPRPDESWGYGTTSFD